MQIICPARDTVIVVMSSAALTLGAVDWGQAQSPEQHDIVLQGGRVIDPETGLDGIRNVGIRGDRIVEVSDQLLRGRNVIDVSGLVVAPGFIDLHAHGQTNKANEYQAHDGVTTALELESGEDFLGQWLASRTGRALLNFGATVSHAETRWRAMVQYAEQDGRMGRILSEHGLGSVALATARVDVAQARYEPVPPGRYGALGVGLRRGLEAGALGIGVPVGYYPGATRGEILEVYRFAAEWGAPIFTHVREISLAGIQEAIADATVTRAPLHIVHLNSMALGEIDVALELVASAQARDLDITTEVYPYTAASAGLASTLFDAGWQIRMGITYRDLQWQETGERLTEATFRAYRQEGGLVIIHLMKADWVDAGVASPVTLISSDGMPYAPGAHPRSAGTFARVLGRYVRERGMLTLKEALAKMTIRPAQRLADIAPAMRLKGRIQVGCDADITVFDPGTIIDTATFEDDLSFSEGVRHVVVNGTFVVKSGETVAGVYPGRAVVGRYRQ